jgi:hypothetical protein
MKITGASADDLRVLLVKKMVISFDNNRVLVIADWKIHNNIRGDRYNETIFKEYKRLLSLNENNQYVDVIPDVIPVVCQVGDTGKDRLGKDRLGYNTAPPEGVIVENLLEEVDKKGIKYDYQYFGLDIFNKTSAPKNKKAECIRIAKLYPKNIVTGALSFALDYPNPSLKWKMFLFKLNELNRNEKTKLA